MRGSSRAIAERLSKELGYYVEYLPDNLCTPYLVNGTIGARDAAQVREVVRESREQAETPD